MANYKLYVNDRNYSSWDVFDTINFNKIKLDINPIDFKLFSNEIFSSSNGSGFTEAIKIMTATNFRQFTSQAIVI